MEKVRTSETDSEFDILLVVCSVECSTEVYYNTFLK